MEAEQAQDSPSLVLRRSICLFIHSLLLIFFHAKASCNITVNCGIEIVGDGSSCILKKSVENQAQICMFHKTHVHL